MTLSVEHILFVLPRWCGTHSTCSHHSVQTLNGRNQIMLSLLFNARVWSFPRWHILWQRTLYAYHQQKWEGNFVSKGCGTKPTGVTGWLVIRRGIWIPWTSWKCAAFHWLAWLLAHFFSVFDSYFPTDHSSFLMAGSSCAVLPFPFSAVGWYV